MMSLIGKEKLGKLSLWKMSFISDMLREPAEHPARNVHEDMGSLSSREKTSLPKGSGKAGYLP